MSDYVESGWGFLNDSPGSSSGSSSGSSTDSPGSSNDSSGSYAYGDNVSGVDFSIPSSAPAPVVPASTPAMTTGFGSVFGASSGSTGSSLIVQDALSDMIDQNVQATIDQQGYVQHSDLQDAINAAYNNFYPQIDQYTLDEFVDLYGEDAAPDWQVANASTVPGFANLMGIPPGQTSVGQEWINDWYAGNTGGGGGGGGGGWSYGGGGGGRGGGYGGGGGTPKYGGDFAGENPWGQSHIQRKWIQQLRNPHGEGYFRGYNRGGIVSLC